MKDSPSLDDQFKSDKYEVSLNELFFSRTYNPSVNSVSRLLDNNGYFGRYKIETLTNRKFGTDVLIRVHVYLIDSVFTYTWPYNTFFNIDNKSFGHNRKAPRGVLSDKSMLSYVFTLLSSIFSRRGKTYKPSMIFESHCDECLRVIQHYKLPLSDWPYTICNIHGTAAHRPYLEKVIPFLVKVGLISNNKFKLNSIDDAEEVCENLFDIDYWYNI
jgi:hypothetical protein